MSNDSLPKPDSLPKTDFQSLLPELYAGVFLEQIETQLSDIAANVVTHGKNGEMTIKLKVSQIGDSHQVQLKHSIKSIIPKARGRVIEENQTETPLHVSRGGVLTRFPYPDAQGRFEMGAGEATGTPDSHKTFSRN